MKLYRLFLLISCFTTVVRAQTFEWATSDTTCYPSSIIRDKTNNIFVTGSFQWNKFFIAKYNSAGNLDWRNNLSVYIRSIAIDTSGNLYAGGAFTGTVEIGNDTFTADGPCNVFLAKFNTLGQVQWVSRSYCNASTTVDAITTDNQGNILIVGRFQDSLRIDSFIFDAPLTNQIFLAKYTPTGICLWAKHLISESFDGGVNGPKIKTDNHGNTYISGHFITHAIFDSITIPAHGNLDMDIFLTKIDNTGNFLWAKGLGGAYQETSGPMDVDSMGNIYISGYYESPTAYFDTYTLTTNDYSYFTAKYTTDGSCQWVKKAYTGALCATENGFYTNAPGLISCYDALGDLQWTKTATGANNVAMVSADTDVYITGSYSGTANFDSHTLSSSNSQMYIAKLGAPAITTGVKENNNTIGFTIYPNPGSGVFTISFVPETQNTYIYNISNTLGQTVYTETIQASDTYSKQVNLSTLHKGSYYANLYCGSSANKKQLKECRKIVIQ